LQYSSAGRAPMRAEASAKWDKFVNEHLLPITRVAPPSDMFNIYMDGSGFKELEISEALSSDMLFTFGSVCTVFVYVLFHVRSLLLTIVGIVICLLSVPLAYILCALLTGTNTVNFTAFLAVFLAVGLGCDVIFVYSDFWNESARKFGATEYAERLAWTYTHAGRASFVTTATTALSFFANLASVIRALRQFGFFMGLCVMLAWALISLLYVPLCVLDERIAFCRLCGAKVGQLGTTRARYMGKWADVVQKWRHAFLYIPTCIIVIGLAISVFMVKPGQGIPKLFPEDHNRVKGEAVLSKFEGISKTPFASHAARVPQDVKVCSELDFATDPIALSKDCTLFWCEVTLPIEARTVIAKDNSCECHRLPKPKPCAQAKVVARVVSTPALAKRLEGFEGDVNGLNDKLSFQRHLLAAAGNGLNFSMSAMTRHGLPQIVQHEWESGQIKQLALTQLQFGDFRTDEERSSHPSSSCGWDEICFCGAARPCSLDRKWKPAGTLVFAEPTSRRLVPERSGQLQKMQVPSWRLAQHGLKAGRRLQSNDCKVRDTIHVVKWTKKFKVPASKRIKVRVGFGLNVDTGFQMLGERDLSTVWSYNTAFEARAPWTQRKMYQFCKDLEKNADLRVARAWCWMINFKDFARCVKKTRFPVSGKLKDGTYAFDSFVTEYMERSAGHMSGIPKDAMAGDKYIWVVDGSLKAIYASFEVDVSRYSSSSEILKIKQKWDDHISKYNQGAADAAKGAICVSKNWVEAEANAELIGSAVVTLVILLILAFVFMVAFTWSISLSLFVVMATLSAIGGLTFFIVVPFQWEVGLIEVIAIVYFIGYAVTYSLHIAHKYACEEEEDESLPGAYPAVGEAVGVSELGAGVGLDASEEPAKGWLRCCSCCASGPMRYSRSRFALVTMGGATMGSAITTAGSAFFLTLCTLTIFQRLGTMCLTVTVVSIVIALGPLPAALMIFGPLLPGQCGDLPSRLARRADGLSGKVSAVLSPTSSASRSPADGSISKPMQMQLSGPRRE